MREEGAAGLRGNGCENDAPLASTPRKWKLLFKETPDDGSACLKWAELSLYQSIVENDVMGMTRGHLMLRPVCTSQAAPRGGQSPTRGRKAGKRPRSNEDRSS